jgi:sirohydrochlorin ferrochelatase
VLLCLRIHSAGLGASMKETVRLVLFVPGTDEARARKPFEELADGVRNELGKDHVRLAYINSGSPTLADVAQEAAEDGVSRLRILPVVLSHGGPLEKQIQEQAAVVRGQIPLLTVDLLPQVGDHPRMKTLLHALAREAAR